MFSFAKSKAKFEVFVLPASTARKSKGIRKVVKVNFNERENVIQTPTYACHTAVALRKLQC